MTILTKNKPIFFASNQHFTKEVTKELISRKISLTAFHSILCTFPPSVIHIMEITEIYFGKNLVKPTYLLKKSLNSWFDEKSFRLELMFIFHNNEWFFLCKNSVKSTSLFYFHVIFAKSAHHNFHTAFWRSHWFHESLSM